MRQHTRFRLSRNQILALALIALGAALRLWGIGSLPPGLNQDEASAGYEAWALLHYGIDRNGASLPALFVAWGSGQNVLYSYLSMPFIALFGLNETTLRLVAGLCGTLSLPLFYRLGKRLRGERFGLVALALLAANPWHIMLSRWALESNLLPFCLLAGVTLYLEADARPALLIPAAAAFGLSLYAYGTAFYIVPLLLVWALVSLIRRRAVRPRVFFPALALFLLLAAPITLCNLVNLLGWETIRLGPLTLPALTEARQLATTGGDPLHNLLAFLRLLWTQSDGLPWNATEPFGILYGWPGLLLAGFGLLRGLFGRLRGSDPAREGMLYLWLGGSFLSALVIQVNINRMNMAFLPLIYFQALGAQTLLAPLTAAPRRAAAGLAAGAVALAVALGLFLRSYATTQRDRLSVQFFEGLGEAIACAETYSRQAAGEPLPIRVTDAVNAPYIYVLFYTRTPPQDFLDTVEYANPDGAFRSVTAFGHYRFGGALPDEGLAILPRAQAAATGGEILGQFGHYAVVALHSTAELCYTMVLE